MKFRNLFLFTGICIFATIIKTRIVCSGNDLKIHRQLTQNTVSLFDLNSHFKSIYALLTWHHQGFLTSGLINNSHPSVFTNHIQQIFCLLPNISFPTGKYSTLDGFSLTRLNFLLIVKSIGFSK